MTTLHIESNVRDFDEWKAVFDKFERFREEHGVRSYKMARGIEDPNRVTIDLDFDTREEATAFGGALEKIWATPQSKAQLLSHSVPALLEPVS